MYYKAFISYSHTKDNILSPILQHSLETFGKKWYQIRHYRIFRDETNLTASPSLWNSIEKSLQDSEYFLYLASPLAAKSKWVKKEIQWWLNNKGTKKLLIILTSGEIYWSDTEQGYNSDLTNAVPLNLLDKFTDEPLYIDLRWAKNAEINISLDNPKFQSDIATIVSVLLQRNKDSLIGYNVKQLKIRRKFIQTVVSLLVLLLIASSASTFIAIKQTEIAKKNEKESLRTQSLFLADLSRQYNEKDLSDTAVRLALEALPKTSKDNPQRPFVWQAQYQLYIGLVKRKQGIFEHHDVIKKAIVSPEKPLFIVLSGNNAYLYDIKSLQLLNVLRGHTDRINDVTFSPDGKYIVTASADKTARLWDEQGNNLLEQKHEYMVNYVTFSPDNKKIVTITQGGNAHLWDTEGNTLSVWNTSSTRATSFSPDGNKIITAYQNIATLWDTQESEYQLESWEKNKVKLSKDRVNITNVAFSPNGKQVFTVSYNQAYLWDMQGNVLATFKGHNHNSSILDVAFSSDGKHIITACSDNTARLWDVQGNTLAVLKGHTGSVNSASFSPDEKHIITASDDNTARLWDIQGNTLAVLKGHTGSVISATFSVNGKYILTVSGKIARLWNKQGNDLNTLTVLQKYKYGVNSASFSPDSKQIVTTSKTLSNEVHLWDMKGNILGTFKEDDYNRGGSVRNAIFSPSGKQIIIQSLNVTAYLWDIESDNIIVLKGHDGVIYSADFNFNGTQIITASQDGTARLWDAQGNSLAVLQGHKNNVWSAVFSPDGKYIATASDDNTARLWDLQGNTLAVLIGHKSALKAITFSPNSKQILTASRDNTARLWDLKGNSLAVLQGHTHFVNHAIFSLDGKYIATAAYDNTARLWDVKGNTLAVLRGHKGNVRTIIFSPNGEQMLTASSDNTARLWDMQGNTLAVLQGHKSGKKGLSSFGVNSAMFSPDGKQIVTASDDNTARLWPTFKNLDDLIQQTRTTMTRKAFTCAERELFFLKICEENKVEVQND